MEPLESILGNLHSDDNRLQFLKRVYRPGKKNIADAILSITPDNVEVLESEAEHAREQGDSERFLKLARSYIDTCLKGVSNTSVLQKVEGWGNPELVSYTISRVENSVAESILDSATKLASAYGFDDEAHKLLERLYDIRKKDPYTVTGYLAAVAVQIGRFDEAIDFYLESGFSSLGKALAIAQEHVPSRSEAIAKLGFKNHNKGVDPEAYVRCAKVLGKEAKAGKHLAKEARKLKVVEPPQNYMGLVKALKHLGLDEEARSVVYKVGEKEPLPIGVMHYPEKEDAIADLFLEIGEDKQAGDIYRRKVKRCISFMHAESLVEDIDKAYDLTGDETLLETKLFLYERDGKYSEAERLAGSLGLDDLQETYKAMKILVNNLEN